MEPLQSGILRPPQPDADPTTELLQRFSPTLRGHYFTMRRFVGGQCALEAFYHNLQPRPRISEYLCVIHSLLTDQSKGFSHYYQEARVLQYLRNGQFLGDEISFDSLLRLTFAYDYTLTIVIEGQSPLELGNGSRAMKLAFVGDMNAGHFQQPRPIGGAIDKFPDIIQKCAVKPCPTLDVSAAPGFLSNMLRCRGYNVTSGIYLGSDHANATQKLDNVITYRHHGELFDNLRHRKRMYMFIVNDAARPVDSETLIDDINNQSLLVLARGGSLLTKSFGNGLNIFRLASKFKSIDCVHQSETNTERYFILRGYMNGACDFFQVYDRPGFARDITEHTLHHCDLKRFIREFFTGAFVKLAPVIPYQPKGVFTIKAITGYASASKTTRAFTMFKQAVYIAPSKTLKFKHQRAGVASYTPHTFFGHKHEKATHIIVDESSQFSTDYFSLLTTVYPNHTIVCLGDLEQTPYVNYANERKMLTLRDCGLTNNICDVYKIPQDISALLNAKHRMNIRTHSAVKTGIVLFSGDIYDFAKSKIPVITFNSTSAKDLCDRGVNAQTITTYTGSRDHTVVFYIDSKSVLSQLTTRSEYIYTAVSRATDVLVIAGDHEYITKYYGIHGCSLQTYEEISDVYLSHNIKQADDSTLPVTVPIGIQTLPVSQGVATAIIESCVQAVVDPEKLTVSVGVAAVAPVADGRLRTTVDSVMAIDSSNTGYQFPSARLAKNQISSNTLATVQTLVKRYARGYDKKMDKRNFQYTTNELMNGLCKAIYGNAHSVRRLRHDLSVLASPEFLTERARQYLDALQKKINVNPSTAKEIAQEFDEMRESLTFFNKRQSKFDPKPGFDQSDKVGQGVAATSKRMNVVFAAYARGLLDAVRELVTRHQRKIIIATHDSEAGINDLYTQYVDGERFDNWSCNDFSEWDSSFRSCFSALTSTLIQMIGCPPELAKWFAFYREEWTMLYRNKYGTTTLQGHEKQFSGNPFTICENTIGNIALCFSIFDYRNIKMALFKGDDSAVACDSCKLTKKGTDILSITGHGLKLHNSPIGEFAGWFLTPLGIFPDVYRYTAKFLGKIYRDQAHFKESLTSLSERCAAVKTQEQLMAGCAMASAYYSNIFGPEAQCDMRATELLFSFLKNSRQITFTDLDKVTLPIVQLDKPVKQ